MKAMILAAGLGTRLKPWTLSHPKALVPVNGVPMLERVIVRLRDEGFDKIVVNVHHFADQIVDFLDKHDFGVEIMVSDESGCLLDTGGGLLRARGLLELSEGPVLVHNVDILSDADLHGLVQSHMREGNDATLLVSERESGRRLVFDGDMYLRGWHSLSDNRFRPEGFELATSHKEYAFSGIYVVGHGMLEEMGRLFAENKFPVMDYFLHPRREGVVKGYLQSDLNLIDIGKPATLSQANEIFR